MAQCINHFCISPETRLPLFTGPRECLDAILFPKVDELFFLIHLSSNNFEWKYTEQYQAHERKITD